VKSEPITTLFLDIGGVLLSNGWDRSMRERAAELFGVDAAEMDERHHLTFDTYEEGKLSLDEYLNRVIFYQERPFSRDEFKAFMFSQSKPYPEMMQLVRDLKARHRLKVAVVSNEGRELTVYRTQRFELGAFVDFFVVSCFVHYRKPDEDIYRIALDIAQVPAAQVAYVEDRAMFVEVARGLGLHAVHHTGYESTRTRLAALGLSAADSPGRPGPLAGPGQPGPNQ
jgi:putative hydrolase of the HAD superfamily